VLEEAKQDEACMAQLEKELAMKDKHLAQLRSQVAQYQKESHEKINQRQMHELLGANVIRILLVSCMTSVYNLDNLHVMYIKYLCKRKRAQLLG
jgi:hypothetical protein